nr:hypothetical protein OG781_08055 [Streptomyces sp. NBC_00830]
MNCVHCGKPLPEGSRRDRAYCDHKCRGLASYYRRKAGIPPPPRWQHPALSSDNPALRSAAAHAKQLGDANGWSPSLIRCAMDGLTAVLEGRPSGKPVKLTEVRTRIPRQASSHRVAEVLDSLDLLDDDSTLAIRAWIDRRTSELPAGFASDVRTWLLVLLDGDSRTRPRSHTCVYVYFGCVKPLLGVWATTRGHLREITVADVTTALDRLRGWRRRNAIAALRSLFRFAQKRGLIFANPTTRLRAENIERSLLPMTDADVLAVQQIAVTPAQRLIVAWPPSTLHAPPPSDASSWTTSTCPIAGSPSQDTPNDSANCPTRPCWPGSTNAAPPGRRPLTGTCSSTRKPPWGPGPSAPNTSSDTCCTTASTSNASAATGYCTKP